MKQRIMIIWFLCSRCYSWSLEILFYSIIELFSEYEKPLSKVVKDDKENGAGNQGNVAL